MFSFKVALLSVACLTTNLLHSQDSLRVYLDYFDAATEQHSAYCYRDLVKQNGSKGPYNSTTYYKSGAIKETGSYAKGVKDFYPIGKNTGYYPNGNKKHEGQYIIDTLTVTSVKVGKWKYYYPNGLSSEEIVYLPQESSQIEKTLIMSYHDSTGNALVTKGNGVYSYPINIIVDSAISTAVFSGSISNGLKNGLWIGKLANGKTYCEEVYVEGNFASGKIFGNKKGDVFTYDSLNSPAKPEKGIGHLLKILQQEVDYPKMERDNDIQGTVLIQFTVYEDGGLNDFTVYRSVSFGLDVEALRAVSQFPRFKPKLVNGKPVKSEFIFPVTFKLI